MIRLSRQSLILTTVVLLAAGVAPGQAQTRPVTRPPAPANLRAYFILDPTLMRASETFRAITDSPWLIGAGAGADIGLWQGLFARVAVTHASRTGQRAVVFDGQAAKTGVPLKLAMTPLEIGGGWQIVRGRRHLLTLVLGGGLIRAHYTETSDFAVPGDDIARTFTGGEVFGGVSLPLFGPVVAGGELQYRGLPNAVGVSGVSKGFGETDLGGLTLRVLVGISR